MSKDFFITVEKLVQKAPANWMKMVCETLRNLLPTTSADYVLKCMPPTNNADLSFLFVDTVRKASTLMSWEALSWTLESSFIAYNRQITEQHIEFLWAGLSPVAKISARRIDQVLYDLIANAKHEILLMTFAAAKIERLVNELIKAKQRGVHIRLILEFAQSSEGQLSYDALKAFPQSFISESEVFYWPVEKRHRNHAGRPGKLHAKLAIVDDTALISSANLTDDAFNRNLEIGVMIKNTEFLITTNTYIESLISGEILSRLKN
jgi:phosphatidylserine/phosphatidylglycerophosphate/cardiolipin synthase-like enzyme